MTATTVSPTLKDAADACMQHDLYDISALLRAALDGSAAASGGTRDELEVASGDARRLTEIAQERLQNAISALSPHV